MITVQGLSENTNYYELIKKIPMQRTGMLGASRLQRGKYPVPCDAVRFGELGI